MSAEVLGRDRAVRVLSTVRVYALLFSLPYMWLLTAGLSTETRWAAMGVHACTVLAASSWNVMADAQRGLAPRLGVTRQAAEIDLDVARVLSWSFAGAAVAFSLGLLGLSPLTPLLVLLALVFIWLATRLPNERKYLAVVEIAAPLVLIVTPAVVLAGTTNASPAVPETIAGAAFLAAVVIAAHIRDRDRDLAARIPTVATRNLFAARGWLLTAALVGTVAGCAPLTVPLEWHEALRAAGALAFGIAAAVRWGRVVALTGAHAVFAMSLLL